MGGIHRYSRSHHRRVFGDEYIDKIRDYGPIAHWPIYERTGTTAHCLINPAQSGVHSGVTLAQTGMGDGYTSGLYDGANDHTNIYTTTFRDAFSGVAGTIALWAKVSAAGVWEDVANRLVFGFRADAENYVQCLKSATNNRVIFYYEAGDVVEFQVTDGLSYADWFHLAMTWDKNAGGTGEVKYYINGTPDGATDTSLGTWAGSLASTTTCIGAASTTPTLVWDGYLAHCAVWTSALAPASIADLYVVGG